MNLPTMLFLLAQSLAYIRRRRCHYHVMENLCRIDCLVKMVAQMSFIRVRTCAQYASSKAHSQVSNALTITAFDY